MIRAALPVTVRDSARALTLPYLIHTMYDLPLGKLPYSAKNTTDRTSSSFDLAP
jgi:hypothetical protein